MSLNAAIRADLQAQLRKANKALGAIMADVGGANTPELRESANVLRKHIRRQVSKKATLAQGPVRPGAKMRGLPSAPGEAPRRQTGRLARSVGQEVVGGVRRVGTNYFVGRLLETGVDSSGEARPTKTGKLRGHSKTAKGRERRNNKIRIEPRPFMEAAAKAAEEEMGDAFVVTLRRRTEGGGT